MRGAADGRPLLVAGNWKMFTRAATAAELAGAVASAADAAPGADVAVFPPFPYLSGVAAALRGSRVALGAQCCHDRAEGAHTGEVSAEMAADVGCRMVLCGHSERRQAGESDEAVGLRVRAALRAGLVPVLCVGETLAERESGAADRVLERQLLSGTHGLAADEVRRVDVAYEPVWAIGTGRTATPETAVAAHRTIRAALVRTFGDAGAFPRILYGGSVKPSNAEELMRSEGVQGVLVGGASLDAASFRAIILAGAAARS
ncbi:MAG: Triosephosphate isomerase [Planctomycetes bacterium]|nr:Triosephosphate isomerase [Planctomycetota bacterium]